MRTDRERLKEEGSEEVRPYDRPGRSEGRFETDRKKNFKDQSGLRPQPISIEASPADLDTWISSANVWASASNVDVLNCSDQRHLLSLAVEKNLFLRLELQP